VTRIARRIDEVVRRPDSALEENHGQAEAQCIPRRAARDQRKRSADDPVEDRWKGVDEAKKTDQPRRERGRNVRRRRAR
jgi:hypothetical protein